MARAHNVTHYFDLMNRAVRSIERETFESALLLRRHVLQHLGFGAYQTRQAACKFRALNMEGLAKVYPFYQAQEPYVSQVRQGREELESMFALDAGQSPPSTAALGLTQSIIELLIMQYILRLASTKARVLCLAESIGRVRDPVRWAFIAPQGILMPEKRAHNRRLMREDAVLATEAGGVRRPVIMLDISRLGVCFTSAALLESGTRHLLDFNLPGTGRLHETVVQVVHSSQSGVPSGYKVGARFVHIEAETTEAIGHFVSHSSPS